MLKSTDLLSVLFLLFFITLGSLSAQEIGKIFSKTEADELYGEVLEYKEMSCNELKILLLETNNNIMFQLKDNEITILGDDRSLLYASSSFTEENQVFHMYSNSKVLELIYKGGANTLRFENRKDVFTITNGEYTLEVSDPCPPYCG